MIITLLNIYLLYTLKSLNGEATCLSVTYSNDSWLLANRYGQIEITNEVVFGILFGFLNIR